MWLAVAKTQNGLITKIPFASVRPRRPRAPPYWVYFFEIHDEADLDDEMRSWLREGYRVGKGIESDSID